MLTEQFKDTVYFSSLLHLDFPELYKELCEILRSNNIKCKTLTNTKDYWCRDFMPVQWGYKQYARFVYDPDYLKGTKQYHTDADKVLTGQKKDNLQINKCPLVIDGGNFIFCKGGSYHADSGIDYAVMTDKVMLENPQYSQEEIENLIRDAFNNQKLNILWLPWRECDLCGHTDGILHYLGTTDMGRPVVLTNLSLYESDHEDEMRSILKSHFELVELNLSEYDDLSWAYINMLQTRDVIIVAGIGNPISDKEALEQIRSLYPEYKDKIYQVQMREFIAKGGGALNCCTWTISNELS